jgi:hypothetical protein
MRGVMATTAKPHDVKSAIPGVTAMMVCLYRSVSAAVEWQFGIMPATGRAAVGPDKRASPECSINFGVCLDLNRVVGRQCNLQ